MRTLDAIARILKTEGIECLSTFHSTALIESGEESGGVNEQRLRARQEV